MSNTEQQTENTQVEAFTEEEQQAALNFKTTFDLFMKSLQKIESRTALARVFREVAEFPLSPSKPKFASKRQEELFITFLALSEYKSQILTAILQKNNFFKGEKNNEQEEQVVAENRDTSQE